MRPLKTHSHTSNGLAMEPGKREEKQLKETQTLQQGKPPIKNLSRTAGVAGGGDRKGSTARTTDTALWQGKPLSIGKRKGNTGADTREKACQKPSADHWHGGG